MQHDTDPFLFYTCAIISFLESRVDTYVENLRPFFQDDIDVKYWLENVWLSEEQEHGRLMRAFVENTWPAFDWSKGFSEFSHLYMPQCETAKLRRSAGLEALARCVTETQASMVYRCLANYTGNTVLQSLLKRMSIDEVRHFRYFKNIHLHHESKEKNRFIRKMYTIVARSELVRDEDIALAFFPLNTCWVELPPFRPWDYQQFLAYMAQVIKVYFPFDEAKRMLFYPLHAKKRLERLLIQITGKIITRQFMRYG